MAKKTLYTGFSTTSPETSFRLTDIELIKRDLLNHIYTIKGERPMRPNWGTRIPMLAFEPLDQTTIDIVKEDLTEVVNDEPRVKLIDMAVLALPDNSAIVAFLDLLYVELGVQETMNLSIALST